MRNPLFKKLPGCLLGAVIAAGVAHTAMVQAVDGTPPGLFELDGNIPDDTAKAGDDWGGLYNGGLNNGGSANLITFTKVLPDPAPNSIFTQGGSKDVNDIPDWKYTDGSVPDKDDITNAYAAAYTNSADVCITGGKPSTCTAGQTPVHKANDMIVYFGFDRLANNGDAFAGFWFFQSDVSLNANGTFSGKHVAKRVDPNNPGKYLPGDMFVTVAYPQASGAVPSIKVYEWDPNDVDNDKNVDPDLSGSKMSPLDLVASSANATCDGNGNKLACAISNLSQQDSPPWPYTPKAGSGLPFESFFEGGINVTRLLGSTPCFASFLAETRSSSSQTAQLKDFVTGGFHVCGIKVSKDCKAAVTTDGAKVKVDFFGTLKNSGGTSYVAYLKDSLPGATIDHVCLDANVQGCADDPDLADMVKKDGGAYFLLAAGGQVRFEGSYITTGLLPNPLKDTVTAQAYGKVEDVGNSSLIIVSSTADAACSYNVNPGLAVTKNCALDYQGGSSATVKISVNVKNNGDVPLSDISVVDDKFGSLTFPGTLDKGKDATYENTYTVNYGSLDATVTGSSENGGLAKVDITHSDKVTATGTVKDSNGTVIDSVSNSMPASCPNSFTRGIDIVKSCDKVVLEPQDGKLVVRVDVKATVTNKGTETLKIDSITDDPAVTFTGLPADGMLAGGANVEVSGSYYPKSSTGDLKFTDTATVNATGVFSSAAATDNSSVDCPLCVAP